MSIENPAVDWIQEEEYLLDLCQSESYEKRPMSRIPVATIYIGMDRDIKHIQYDELDLCISDISAGSILSAEILLAQIEHHKCYKNANPNTIWAFDTHCSFIADYNNEDLPAYIHSVESPGRLVKHVFGKDIYYPTCLPLFHKTNQLFLFYRESLKPILKKTAGQKRTMKKVHITSGSSTRKHLTSS